MTYNITELHAELKSLRDQKKIAAERIEEVAMELSRKHKALNKLHINLMGVAQKIEGNAAVKRRLNDLLGIVESHKLPPAITKEELKDLLAELNILRERVIQETVRRLVLINTFNNLIGPVKVYAVFSTEHLSQARAPTGSSIKVENTNIAINLSTSKAPFKGLFSGSTVSFDVTSILTIDKISEVMVNLPIRNYIYAGNNVLFLGTGTFLGSQSIFGTEHNMQNSLLDLLLTNIYYQSIDTEDYYLRFIGTNQKCALQPVSVEAELRARGMDGTGPTGIQPLAVKVSAVGFQDNGVMDLLDTANTAGFITCIESFDTFSFGDGAGQTFQRSTQSNTKPAIPLLVGVTKLILTGETHAKGIIASILKDVCLEVDTIMLSFEIWSGPTCVSTIGLCQTYSPDAVRAYVTPNSVEDPLCNVFGATLRNLFGPPSSAALLVFAGIDVDDPTNAAATLEPLAGLQKSRTVAVREFM